MTRKESFSLENGSAATGTFGYQDLVGMDTVAESAISKAEAQSDLKRWQANFDSIKHNLATGLSDRNLATVEASALLTDLNVLKSKWRVSTSPEQYSQLESLILQLNKFKEQQAGFFGKLKKWVMPVLAVGGLGAGEMVRNKYQEFDAQKSETAQLIAQEREFSLPDLPDSLLLVPEHADIPSTKDYFKQYSDFVKAHPGKGLGLSIEESKPGLLGTYLKFGRQIDRNVTFSKGFLEKIASRVNIPAKDLETMQGIFHESIYVQPPTMGGGGTSSVFYTTENILPLKEHEDFYAEQVVNAVKMTKQILPIFDQVPVHVQSDLRKALTHFLQADLSVRAYDVRICDAISNERDFELQGVDGVYEDVPSLFERQQKYIEKRNQAIESWYSAVASVNDAATIEKNVVQVATAMQGWPQKRRAALGVSAKEANEGVVLGGAIKEWNAYVQKGDSEFMTNATTLETLLHDYQPAGQALASK